MILNFLRSVGTLCRELPVLMQLLRDTKMKLSELMPELGGIRAQLTKVFGEQQKLVDEQKLKIEDLQTRLEGVELPEDAKGVLGELRSLVQAMDDKIPDVSSPGDIDLGAAPRPQTQPPIRGDFPENPNPVLPGEGQPAPGSPAPVGDGEPGTQGQTTGGDASSAQSSGQTGDQSGAGSAPR
jgi:hypothetical protein